MKIPAALAAVAALVVLAIECPAADVHWQASLGLLPQDACPPWTAVVSDSAPTFVGGALHVRTTACDRNTLYYQAGVDLQLPDTIVVEARLRAAARSECVGPCGHFRDAAAILITTAPNVGTLVFVGVDEVFITNGECAGISSVLVDTDGAAHTYRVVVLPSGVVSVSYDGAPLLTGHTYTSIFDHATQPRILWGEGSSFAFGTTHWESFRHNAHAAGCTTLDAGTATSLAPRAWPNPFREATTLRYSLARPGRVQVDLYDIAGRWIRQLESAEVAAGEQRRAWDGLDAAGRPVGPGMYAYRIRTEDGVRTGKVMRLP